VGKKLSEIAKEQNKSPVEAALELIRTRDLAVASFNMNGKDIDRFMKQKFITTCSDARPTSAQVRHVPAQVAPVTLQSQAHRFVIRSAQQ